MLEVEIATECNHWFVIHIESAMEAPTAGRKITCNVCEKKTKIRSVGVPGRIREPKPNSSEQRNMFEE